MSRYPAASYIGKATRKAATIGLLAGVVAGVAILDLPKSALLSLSGNAWTEGLGLPRVVMVPASMERPAVVAATGLTVVGCLVGAAIGWCVAARDVRRSKHLS